MTSSQPFPHLTRAGIALALTTLAAVLALAAFGPGAALAADPTGAQYDSDVRQIGEVGGGGDADSSEPATGLQKKVVGALPFTGIDLIALAAVALALASLGVALRRLTPTGEIDG